LKYLPGILALTLALTGCGYRVAGTTNLVPGNVQTIAVLPWANVSTQYKLSDYLAESVTRELIARTHYKIVADPTKADAVLYGAVANVFAGVTVATTRSTGAQLVVQLQVRLTDKTGKVIYDRPSLDFRERYEITVDPKQYFDESQAAAQRLSRDVARTVVSSILEDF
jgi:TolB-like protein